MSDYEITHPIENPLQARFAVLTRDLPYNVDASWAAREWEDWCELHYITDPEKFFGTQADYMIQVLLGGNDLVKSGSPDEPKWRLLVLEDAGELLRADAGEVTGKALSRMLNTVDGLIGQGLRVLVLVTTNEDVGKLHPAVARPGRCAVEVRFDPLNGSATADWRRAHHLPLLGGSATLGGFGESREASAHARIVAALADGYPAFRAAVPHVGGTR